VSGVNLMLFAMSGKRFDLLTKFVPKAGIVGLLVNPNNPSTVGSSKDAQATAQALRKKVVVVEGGSEGDIDAAFDQLKQQKVEAISVEADPFLLARRNQIVAKAAQLSLPAIYPHREYVEAGGLVSYGTAMSRLTKLKLGFKDCEGRCRVQTTLIFLSRTGWQAFEIRVGHDESLVTKLSQPLGFLYGWIPTVRKCHSISD
jgi:ABC transporter substrate binding protein